MIISSAMGHDVVTADFMVLWSNITILQGVLCSGKTSRG